MGLNDTAEQLDACRQQSVADEARIRDLETRLAEQRMLTREAGEQAVAMVGDRDRQIAELEHALARAESALADRLQHDAHAHPAVLTFDSGPLRDAIDNRRPGNYPEDWTTDLAEEIIALLQPADGILITPEEAALAIRAARHSAESIRAVLEVDPTRLHPDVAPYVDRLTDLADHLTKETR